MLISVVCERQKSRIGAFASPSIPFAYVQFAILTTGAGAAADGAGAATDGAGAGEVVAAVVCVDAEAAATTAWKAIKQAILNLFLNIIKKPFILIIVTIFNQTSFYFRIAEINDDAAALAGVLLLEDAAGAAAAG